MNELPENVDLRWIGETLVALQRDMREVRRELRDVREDMRILREDVDILAVIARRLDRNVAALREDVQ